METKLIEIFHGLPLIQIVNLYMINLSDIFKFYNIIFLLVFQLFFTHLIAS